MTATREHIALLGTVVALLILSGISPHDRLTWVLEVTPVIIAVLLLTATYQRFPLTPLLYRLIVLHAIILLVGGHYTYAEVPAGYWESDLLGLARNHYDQLGHFAQGFVPSMIARELLLRRTPLRPGAWLFFLIACICLSISALYELIEWWSAVILGQGADAFLGTQGDPWDTQWDMFLALVGAIVAQLTLGRVHDRSLRELARKTV